MEQQLIQSKPLTVPKALPIQVYEADMRKELKQLGYKLAKYAGAEYCALTSSGTAGMLTALKAAGVREGDGVMCTPFSFFSIPEIIELAGAVPVPADINPNTFNIDTFCLEYSLKKYVRAKQPLPKALIASDLFGLICDFDAIAETCKTYGVTLIEDMSGAFGASYKGRKAGTFGRFSVASFFPSRPLGGVGDGGGVFCRNREDVKLIEELRVNDGAQPYDFIQASIVGEKLGRYSDELARRQLVAARYRDNFAGFVKVQQIDEDCISAYTQFVISLDGEEQREHVMDSLRERHIPSSILHSERSIRFGGNDWEKVVPANTQQVAKRLLAIPMHAHLSVHVVDFISECIMETVEEFPE